MQIFNSWITKTPVILVLPCNNILFRKISTSFFQNNVNLGCVGSTVLQIYIKWNKLLNIFTALRQALRIFQIKLFSNDWFSWSVHKLSDKWNSSSFVT